MWQNMSDKDFLLNINSRSQCFKKFFDTDPQTNKLDYLSPTNIRLSWISCQEQTL